MHGHKMTCAVINGKPCDCGGVEFDVRPDPATFKRRDVKARKLDPTEMFKTCEHDCYTISACDGNGTDVRFCILCRAEFAGRCQPENYFHP